MFIRNSINGSVEWLGVPDLLSTNGPACTVNILAPHPSWRDRGSSTNPNWVSQSGGVFGSVSIPWNHPVRFLPVYHCRVFENMRAAAHVRRACKVPPIASTPSSVGRLIVGMMTGVISGMSRLVNSLCG